MNNRLNGSMNGKHGAETLTIRTPPQNIEAERSVLGAILADPATFSEVAPLLRGEDFYRSENAIVWEAIRRLAGQSKPIDALSVADELARAEELARVGGDEAIGSLLSSVPHAANAVYHAQLVRGKAICRHLIEASEQTIRDAYAGLTTSEEQLAAAQQRMFEIARVSAPGSCSHVSIPVDQAYMNIQNAHAGIIEGVTTGFPSLDFLLISLRPGNLAIIAGRPSMGKTAFALGLAAHNAINSNVGTLMFSLEMSGEELATRLLSMHSRIPAIRFRDHKPFDNYEAQQVAKSYDALGGSHLWINDASSLTPDVLASYARQECSRREIGLVIIDYLQLIAGDRTRTANRYEQIGEITRGLKMLARELRVPVVVLSQLNRQCEGREGHRPVLSDMRDSGRIEEDADVVMLVHRPEYYDREDAPGTAEIILAKNRNGTVGMCKLAFVAQLASFESLDSREAF